MSNLLLSCKNICYCYHTLNGALEVLQDISFNVKSGEFISIVGPSGCGKSTLLNLLAGLEKPESGEIEYYSKSKNPTFYGYMLQQDQLFEWYDIWQNVCLGPKINKCLTSDREAYIEKLLNKYGLSDFKNKHPSALSGGMRQRAALIRTLAMQPELLFLDEPFSALDYQTRLNVADDIGSIIKSEKKTAVLVTHDIGEAVSLSDRILILNKCPATVQKTVSIDWSVKPDSSLNARKLPEFSKYFNLVWKELNTI